MENTWKVEINAEGNLYIQLKGNLGQMDNLFGVRELESGLCVYAHELVSLKKLLTRFYPSISVDSLEELEQLVKHEFLENRSLGAFRCFLENAHIPYRAYSNAA